MKRKLTKKMIGIILGIVICLVINIIIAYSIISLLSLNWFSLRFHLAFGLYVMGITLDLGFILPIFLEKWDKM